MLIFNFCLKKIHIFFKFAYSIMQLERTTHAVDAILWSLQFRLKALNITNQNIYFCFYLFFWYLFIIFTAILLNGVAGSTGENKYGQLGGLRDSFVYLLISSLESPAKDFSFHFVYLFFFSRCLWCWVAIFESKESYMIRTRLKVRSAVDKLIW